MAQASTETPVSYRAALLAALRAGLLRKRDGRFRLLAYREYLLSELNAGRLTREKFFARVERACQEFYQREYGGKAARTP